MATSVTTSGITFNDATTQTTAAMGTTSLIKSVQRVDMFINWDESFSKTATISTVNPSKTMIAYLGYLTSDDEFRPPLIYLTGATSVSVSIYNLGSYQSFTTAFEVIEFY